MADALLPKAITNVFDDVALARHLSCYCSVQEALQM